MTTQNAAVIDVRAHGYDTEQRHPSPNLALLAVIFQGPEAGQHRRSERVHRESSVPEPAATAERDRLVFPNLRRMGLVVRLSSVRFCHSVRAFRREHRQPLALCSSFRSHDSQLLSGNRRRVPAAEVCVELRWD